MSDIDGQGVEGLGNWMIFVDVIYVSPLRFRDFKKTKLITRKMCVYIHAVETMLGFLRNKSF